MCHSYKPVFSRYIRKFVVTTPAAEMTRGYIDMLLSFQILLIFRAKFSYFVIFSPSILESLCVKETAVSVTSAVLFSLSLNSLRGLLKCTVVVTTTTITTTTTTTSVHSIYNYIPETTPVSRVHSVASVLQLQFMVHVMLFPMCAVPSMAVVCSSGFCGFLVCFSSIL